MACFGRFAPDRREGANPGADSPVGSEAFVRPSGWGNVSLRSSGA